MAIRKNTSAKADEVKYEVIEKCGIVAERSGGYNLELRYMKWGDGEERYDLRPWKVKDNGTEVCGKGITLSGEELEALGNLIKGMED